MTVLLALCAAFQAPQRVVVDRDDVVINADAVVEFAAAPIADDEGDGVLQIAGDGLRIQFANTPLWGARPGQSPDTFEGIGIRVTGKDVTLRGALVHGFRGGIWASRADGLVLEGCDVSGNRRQRLRSSSKAEDAGDWLWPHENDANQWLTSYGAGIYVEESNGITIRGCRAREGQNGICLRRVERSQVYDNDMSFLSGWGLALYRSSGNVVARNSFDFCVRGYSHGVYARGQDSAGILCFEQCCDNVFAYNSATHSGDGFFGFAGLEALEERSDVPGLGCNRNLLVGNDFSYAPAIGIEMTFSRDNVFLANRLCGSNYGVWGGYSSHTEAWENRIEDNALAGIAVEHGSRWTIGANRFARNARAIELWWDEDADLLAKPWAKLNPTVSAQHWIGRNRFEAERVQLELRGPTTGVVFELPQEGADRSTWKVDAAAQVEASEEQSFLDPGRAAPDALPGKRQAVGALAHLEGRDKIIVTEWGPYDWVAPLLHYDGRRGDADAWRLLGNDVPIGVHAGADVVLRMDASAAVPVVLVSAREAGRVVPYELRVRVPSKELSGRGVLASATWRVVVGAWSSDPREDPASWREQVGRGVTFEVPSLALRYGGGGPSELEGAPQAVKEAQIGRDAFGTLASTKLVLPKGRWRLATTSDDGVRVKLDGRVVIENWTWHGPTGDAVEVEFEQDGVHELEVEHFELDGWATLEFEVEPAGVR
jgi:parallel beta-helix repeat protein